MEDNSKFDLRFQVIINDPMVKEIVFGHWWLALLCDEKRGSVDPAIRAGNEWLHKLYPLTAELHEYPHLGAKPLGFKVWSEFKRQNMERMKW